MNGSEGTKRIAKVVAATATLVGLLLGTAVVSHEATASGGGTVQEDKGGDQNSNKAQNGSGIQQKSGNRNGDGTQVNGDGGRTVTGHDNQVEDRPVASGGRGDTSVSGAEGPVHTGDGDQNNGAGAGATTSERHESTTDRHDTSATSDRHDTTATARTGAQVNTGSGSQHNTVNNFPSEAPTPGQVTLFSAAASDGAPTMSSEVSFTIDVAKLPTNHNRLFLVCRRMYDSPSTPDLYYARAEITEPGRQTTTIAFGGSQANDPAVIGTVRTCAVWTEDPGASATVAQLMYFDSHNIEYDPDGQPYDARRTSMPDGSTLITDSLRIEIARLARPS